MKKQIAFSLFALRFREFNVVVQHTLNTASLLAGNRHVDSTPHPGVAHLGGLTGSPQHWWRAAAGDGGQGGVHLQPAAEAGGGGGWALETRESLRAEGRRCWQVAMRTKVLLAGMRGTPGVSLHLHSPLPRMIDISWIPSPTLFAFAPRAFHRRLPSIRQLQQIFRECLGLPVTPHLCLSSRCLLDIPAGRPAADVDSAHPEVASSPSCLSIASFSAKDVTTRSVVQTGNMAPHWSPPSPLSPRPWVSVPVSPLLESYQVPHLSSLLTQATIISHMEFGESLQLVSLPTHPSRAGPSTVPC